MLRLGVNYVNLVRAIQRDEPQKMAEVAEMRGKCQNKMVVIHGNHLIHEYNITAVNTNTEI
jgi:hypothetical protein